MSVQEELELSSQDISERFWVQDGAHFGRPLTPLFSSYMIPALTEGTRRAMDVLKAPIAQFIGKIRDGYYYQAVVIRDGDPETLQHDHGVIVMGLMGNQYAGLRKIVGQVFMPMHQEIDDLARTVDDSAAAQNALARLQEIYTVFWDLHFQIVLPRMMAGFRFEEVFQQAFPEQDSAHCYELLQGTMNKTLETDRELWKLAEEAKKQPTVLASFASEDVYQSLQNDPSTQSFRDQMDEFLSVYGWRAIDSHEFVNPTWREDPNYCLMIIKGYIDHGFDFETHWQTVVSTREERLEEAVANIKDREIREAFIVAHRDALEAWPIDEDHHFYIDAMLPARARQLMLTVGKIMVQHEILNTPNDIFFLYLDEIISGLQGDGSRNITDLIVDRRALFARQLKTNPVPAWGTPPDDGAAPDPLLVRVFGAGAPVSDNTTTLVRGFAASPGVYRGSVRIVEGPEEFFKVVPGDVLVCRTTSPSWTGLFGVVGAVITETGGILSHAATVAREYGIPCIVGTQNARQVFQDGQLVLVDGAAGTAIVDD